MQLEEWPLTLALYDEVEACMRTLRSAYGTQTPSEYAFSNLYLFRQAHDYRYRRGSLPCIAGTTYDGVRHVLPLFDPRERTTTELAHMLGAHACLYPVPEAVLPAFDPDRFQWTASEDDADYFYPAANFRAYRGQLLHKKKNLMQQLLSTHQIDARALADDTLHDARAVLAAWMHDKDKRAGDTDDGACMEALQLHACFRMDGLVYYDGAKPVGFLIAQELTPTVAVMRFAKGCDSHKGIYQYMFHHYCSSRPRLEWINFEQDLGLANFRQTKRSYQPSSMLRKYRVSLR